MKSRHLIDLLKNGDISKLEEASAVIDVFPNGEDSLVHRSWLINAIDCGTLEVVKWVIDKGVDLSVRDEEGYTPLLRAIERDQPEKYEVMKLLIERGADINQHGINDWTPLHMAAVREDIQALELLVNNGADLNEKTNIDHYATPLEEAIHLGCLKSVEFLENYV